MTGIKMHRLLPAHADKSAVQNSEAIPYLTRTVMGQAAQRAEAFAKTLFTIQIFFACGKTFSGIFALSASCYRYYIF
jgi:hypothetical protein